MTDEKRAIATLKNIAEIYKSISDIPDDGTEDTLTQALRRDMPIALAIIERQEQVIKHYKLIVEAARQLSNSLDIFSESYGQPMVDDPRDYTPDEECCSQEEISAWKEACVKADLGESVEIPRHLWAEGMHLSYNPWGIGISRLKNEWDSEKLKLDALLAQEHTP